MISAVLSAAIACAGGAADSAPRNDVAIVRVGARDVRAQNPTTTDRVLIVGDAEAGSAAAVLLPAGSDATYHVPGGLQPGWYVELVTLGAAGPERTGPIPLALARSAPLVVLATPGHACAFVAGASAPVASTAASAAATAGSCTCSTGVALVHVPVVVPTESSGPSRPPELDPEPLPVL